MQLFLVLHSLLRWAVLILGILVVVRSLKGRINKSAYLPSDNSLNLFFMISCDIQLLLGFVLYFGKGWLDVLKNLGSSDPSVKTYNRFFSMEHLTMMLLAWALVHIGRVVVKKASDDFTKHRKSLLFFGIALLLILAAIPWPFREALQRQWLPAF